jgi:hypothetical protein
MSGEGLRLLKAGGAVFGARCRMWLGGCDTWMVVRKAGLGRRRGLVLLDVG